MIARSDRWSPGDVAALRYITTDGRIEMCWPCRVVEDSEALVALFVAAGSAYKAGPKRSAIEKRRTPGPRIPPAEYVWRADMLRLMFPNRRHSVSLFWQPLGDERRLSKYFINMEEPFRRTRVGLDTQDHTLDIVVQPDLSWHWRDEEELENHVREAFYTADLAAAARAEGESVIEEITRGTHPCRNHWDRWSPDPHWVVPDFPDGWDTTPVTFWDQRAWAYGVSD